MGAAAARAVTRFGVSMTHRVLAESGLGQVTLRPTGSRRPRASSRLGIAALSALL